MKLKNICIAVVALALAAGMTACGGTSAASASSNMSYEMRRLPGIIVLLPVHLLSWTPVDFSDMFRELRRLKEEKYGLKFKQRLTALIAGDLLYFTGVWYYFISPNL